jgi:hypothetical protein
MDMKVENIKETSEGTEEDDDAKNDNKDEQENAENDDVVAKTSTNEQGETTDEIRKEVSSEFSPVTCEKLDICSFANRISVGLPKFKVINFQIRNVEGEKLKTLPYYW